MMDNREEEQPSDEAGGRSIRSDRDLIDAAGRGDPLAFEGLYGRYRDWVFRLAWRFTRDRDLALDVLQDTFTYLLRRLPTLQLTARLTTFLYPAVRNLSLAALRRNRKFPGGEEILDEMPARSEAAEGLSEELAAALALVPQAQRQVVLMRFVDEMSIEEIAEALAVPPGTVKSRLHHAIETLRNDGRTRRYFQP
jgi:RNA polymerase sigma-70 factor, ECF subfamily